MGSEAPKQCSKPILSFGGVASVGPKQCSKSLLSFFCVCQSLIKDAVGWIHHLALDDKHACKALVPRPRP